MTFIELKEDFEKFCMRHQLNTKKYELSLLHKTRRVNVTEHDPIRTAIISARTTSFSYEEFSAWMDGYSCALSPFPFQQLK